jgi:hypothetical protein
MATSVHETSGSTITYWTLIVRAQGSGEDAAQAMGQLLMRHRRFVVWFMGYVGYPSDLTADDLFQEFAMNIVRRGDIRRLRRNGNLRGWLKLNLRWFLCNEWDKWRQRCRAEPMSFDVYHMGTPEDHVVDGAFLADVLSAALQLARERSGNRERFDKLARFLPGPQQDIVKVAALARSLDMSEVALRRAIWEERARFERCLNEVILDAMDVGDEEQDPDRLKKLVEQEKRTLWRAFEAPERGVITDQSEELR